ncbi:MAG: LPXTG cell wall anchor domain-containing protein [Oscillospiraceae bacterium]|nr:LPXTG cell wall anchor domain-containing protein [Oscillospiraceae bacterium]
MGTTLFIVGGGLTAAAAGIYLVSRKRAKDTE